jgi:hypothetical protein
MIVRQNCAIFRVTDRIAISERKGNRVMTTRNEYAKRPVCESKMSLCSLLYPFPRFFRSTTSIFASMSADKALANAVKTGLAASAFLAPNDWSNEMNTNTTTINFLDIGPSLGMSKTECKSAASLSETYSTKAMFPKKRYLIVIQYSQVLSSLKVPIRAYKLLLKPLFQSFSS